MTGVNYSEAEQKTYTTIKFLEYDSQGNPLEPKYFTFSGNIIQFQSLVVRFDDIHIRQADRLKDKSAYLFWKVFMLDGKNTQEYDITKINEVPQGYKLESCPRLSAGGTIPLKPDSGRVFGNTRWIPRRRDWQVSKTPRSRRRG